MMQWSLSTTPSIAIVAEIVKSSTQIHELVLLQGNKNRVSQRKGFNPRLARFVRCVKDITIEYPELEKTALCRAGVGGVESIEYTETMLDLGNDEV